MSGTPPQTQREAGSILAAAQRKLDALPPAADALQSIRVARKFLPGVPADWQARLRQIVDGLPKAIEFRHDRLDQEASSHTGPSVEIANRDGFAIDPPAEHGVTLIECRNFALRGARQTGPGDPERKYFIEITGCEDFVIDAIAVKRGGNGIFLHRCRRFRITGAEFTDLDGYGIILFDCTSFSIEGVRSLRCLASTIMCLGATQYGLIRDVIALEGRGFMNCDAGIHFNHCTTDLEARHVPDSCHEARSIVEKTKRPSFIVVEETRIESHRAQGIYLEGAAACVFRKLQVLRNNKEGICFDWGTILCSIEQSEICDNGERAGLSMREIEIDFLHSYPLLKDGSSSCKLPAVSFDNAALNRVHRCRMSDNHGGAIKIVRASSGNEITNNQIGKNSRGDNRYLRFRWFYSTDLGDVNGEFEDGTAILDFGRSYGNLVDNNAVALLRRSLQSLFWSFYRVGGRYLRELWAFLT